MAFWGTEDEYGTGGMEPSLLPSNYASSTPPPPPSFPVASASSVAPSGFSLPFPPSAPTGVFSTPSMGSLALLSALLGKGGTSENPLAALFGGGAGGISSDILSGLMGLGEIGLGIGTGNPFGILAGVGGLGSLFANIFGGLGGLPREAKTSGFIGGLQGSGNPIEQMLANYLQRRVVNQGDVLSSSGVQANPQLYTNILELMSGIGVPLTGGVLSPPGQTGYNNPAVMGGVRSLPWLRGAFKYFDPSRGYQPLSLDQLKSISPEIEQLVQLHLGGGPGVFRKEFNLANKLREAETY